jgi:hypothetical protein
MSRSGSSTRRPALRPGTAQKRIAQKRVTPKPPTAQPSLARQQELTTKRRGELAELAFTLKAASLGFGVAKPYGDSERYDFILDPRNATLACHAATSTCHSEPAQSGGEEPAFPNRCPTLREVQRMGTHPLHRVQVKCSTQLLNGLYRVNAHRRTQGRAVLYLPSEIDFFAVYIIPEDTWYVIPILAIHATSLFFRRRRDRRPGLYDQYREAWHLLCSIETK